MLMLHSNKHLVAAAQVHVVASGIIHIMRVRRRGRLHLHRARIARPKSDSVDRGHVAASAAAQRSRSRLRQTVVNPKHLVIERL